MVIALRANVEAQVQRARDEADQCWLERGADPSRLGGCKSAALVGRVDRLATPAAFDSVTSPHFRRIVPIRHQAFCGARSTLPPGPTWAIASLNAESGYVAAMGKCSVPAAIIGAASRRIPGILARYSERPS